MGFSLAEARGGAMPEGAEAPPVPKSTFSLAEARGGPAPEPDPDTRPKPGRTERFTSEVAAIGDFILGAPGMFLGTGANLASTAVGLVAGQSPREAWSKGREIGQRVAGPVSAPLQKLLSASPTFARAYDEALTTGALDKLNSFVENVGESVEKRTGGRVLKEQVQTGFDTLMTAMMGGGAARASAPKPLYDAGMKVRVTDPRQIFKDDASYDAFEKDFGATGTQVATRPKTQETGEVGPARGPRPRPKGTQDLVDPGTPEWHASDVAKAAALGAGALGLSAMDQDEAGAALAVVGGIKAKGGMWHPEAVRRLRESLEGTQGLTRGYPEGPAWEKFGDDKTHPATAFADQMVSRYLNRYAGTADDPLKDVKLPSGKTWEEVTDAVTGSAPAKYFSDVRGASLDEPVFAIRDKFGPDWKAEPVEGNRTQYLHELTSYLSHVGDYLRQNVDPAKLAQYDLVRAVKETAKNDERVAKEMEKARGAMTAQLPVHKDTFNSGQPYPEGMKWVELKLPEKLTEEQQKGIRRVTKEEAKQFETDAGIESLQFDSTGRFNQPSYVAVNAKGKPIENSYTQELAGGKTPEEAWLAGRLAEEGNTMGHCVGGYCEGVASGESKIYSLRDKKGESHVTVEVNPQPEKSAAKFHEAADKEFQDRYPLPSGDYYQKSWIEAVKNSPEFKGQPSDILQIKGKQNRAPDAKYLPFVQDFVKGGKWGEVGDLEGTGLYPMGTASGSVYPRGWEGKSQRAHERLEPGYYTEEEIRTANWKGISLPDLKEELSYAHPNVEIDLREHRSGALTLANIELRPVEANKGQNQFGKFLEGEPPKGEGRGQAAIDDITSYADANGRGMMLTAAPREGGPPLAKLVEIYKRFDFVESPNQPFPEIAVNMYRNPKGATRAEVPAGTEASVPEVQEPLAGGAGRGAAEGRPALVQAPRPPRGVEGSVETRLLVGLAGAGVGAVLAGELMDDPSIRGVLISAAAGGLLPYVGRIARTLGDIADPVAGMLSTRIKNISEPIHLRALDFEREVLRDTTKYITAGANFLRSLNKLGDPELNRAIVSNDQAAIKAALLRSNNPELIQGWMHAREALREIGTRLHDIGRISTVLEDYFPRVVKDVEGLLGYLGHEARTDLQTKIANAERAAVAEGGLSDLERSKIINQYLSGRLREGKPGFAKGRSVKEVTDDLMQFYMEPGEAYTHYVNAAVNDLAKAKFFGRDVAKSKGAVDVDTSIGNVVDRELREGRIDFSQADELRNLLGARFGPETRMLPEGATRTIQRVQNLSYAGLLGNLVAAATQIADTGMAVYANGLAPSLAAVARKLTGNMQIKAADLGVVNHISDEFTTQGKSARFLNNVLKYSGFTLIDRAGKDILVQGAYSKFKRQAETQAGRAELGRQYAEAFGDEFLPLVDDLRSGEVTDRVQSLLFAELSRYQPISRLEAPEMHNRIPDIRPAYMLKRWMLKQADVVRRDGYNEMKKGNLTQGTKNMTRFALALGISGATTQLIKDWLENKPMDEENWFPIMDNVLKTFNWSEYTADLLKREGPGAVAANIIAPPYRMWDTILRGDPRAIQHIPVIGRMLYGHFFQEEIEKREEAKKRRKEREANK